MRQETKYLLQAFGLAIIGMVMVQVSDGFFLSQTRVTSDPLIMLSFLLLGLMSLIVSFGTVVSVTYAEVVVKHRKNGV